jgi:hypothetical protein
LNRIICVSIPPLYQEGGYVEKLYEGLRRNLTEPFEFNVLRESKYPSWWAKMDAFATITEPSVYMDLDTVITGNCDFLFDYTGEFCIRKNPWSGAWCDASLISLSPQTAMQITGYFFEDPERAMRTFRSDQEMLAYLFQPWDVWSPGKTASYKADHLENGPGDASIVAFHGEPKPHQLPETHWVREYWK